MDAKLSDVRSVCLRVIWIGRDLSTHVNQGGSSALEISEKFLPIDPDHMSVAAATAVGGLWIHARACA